VFLKPNRILLQPIGEDISMYILYAKAFLFFAFEFFILFFQKPESKFVQLRFSFSPKIRTKVSWILKNVPKTGTRGIYINRIKQLHTTTIPRLWTLNLFYYCCKWLFDHPKSFGKAEGNLIIQKLLLKLEMEFDHQKLMK
jgi:hypothetical protein